MLLGLERDSAGKKLSKYSKKNHNTAIGTKRPVFSQTNLWSILRNCGLLSVDFSAVIKENRTPIRFSKKKSNKKPSEQIKRHRRNNVSFSESERNL